MKIKAIILDRDGTLIEHVPYLHIPSDVKLLPGVRDALRMAIEADIKLFLHTNQSGVGRGMFSLAEVHNCNQRMIEEIGIPQKLFERICIAPERPDEESRYRKPSANFALEIMDEWHFSSQEICYIGDRASDLATAHAAGTLAAGVSTGMGDLRSELQAIDLEAKYPIFDSLLDAVCYLLSADD